MTAYDRDVTLTQPNQLFLEKALEKVADYYHRQGRIEDAIDTLEFLLDARHRCEQKSLLRTA